MKTQLLRNFSALSDGSHPGVFPIPNNAAVGFEFAVHHKVLHACKRLPKVLHRSPPATAGESITTSGAHVWSGNTHRTTAEKKADIRN